MSRKVETGKRWLEIPGKLRPGDPRSRSSRPRAARTPGRFRQCRNSPLHWFRLQMTLKLRIVASRSLVPNSSLLTVIYSFKPFSPELHHITLCKWQLWNAAGTLEKHATRPNGTERTEPVKSSQGPVGPGREALDQDWSRELPGTTVGTAHGQLAGPVLVASHGRF